MERRHVNLCSGIGVSASIEEETGYRDVSAHRGVVQGGHVSAVAGVHLFACIEQALGLGKASRLRR
jgi:hypothetical protein